MFRSLIVAALSLAVVGCAQQQVSNVPEGPLPVVPLSQRIDPVVLKGEREGCISLAEQRRIAGLTHATASSSMQMCNCFHDIMQVSLSREEFARGKAAQITDPNNTQAFANAVPVVRSFAAECLRRVQPY